MDMELTALEARVVGCLIEKEVSTPEHYPLSLNALTNACNQKSNRDPVLTLDQSTVQQTVDELIKQRLVMEKSGFGSRVPKYQHRFCNTEFGTLKFTEQELGIVCALFLRGPQTPGELRTNAGRLAKFNDMQQVETALESLMIRTDGPFVAQLPREPGKRESRYMHLFSGPVQAAPPAERAVPTSTATRSNTDRDRIERLEKLVTELRDEVEQLKHRVG